PCQGHPCGCRSAEDCWQHCCCLSPEERWAWARAHDVEPPAYAERPSVQGWHATPLCDQEAEAGGSAPTCSHCANSACPDVPSPACCEGSHPPSACCHAEPARPDPVQCGSDKARSARVVGLAALNCRGATTLWVSTGTALPPPPVVTWNPDCPLRGCL